MWELIFLIFGMRSLKKRCIKSSLCVNNHTDQNVLYGWTFSFVLRLVNTFMLLLVIFLRYIPLRFPKETFDLGLVYNGATELLFLWCKDAWDQNILMTASAQSTGINLENLNMWKEKSTLCSPQYPILTDLVLWD